MDARATASALKVTCHFQTTFVCQISLLEMVYQTVASSGAIHSAVVLLMNFDIVGNSHTIRKARQMEEVGTLLLDITFF